MKQLFDEMRVGNVSQQSAPQGEKSKNKLPLITDVSACIGADDTQPPASSAFCVPATREPQFYRRGQPTPMTRQRLLVPCDFPPA
jgi:hypothetical protein